MFPEDDLRAEFWLFIRQRAFDPHLRHDEPAGTPALDWLEETRATVAHYLDDTSQRVRYETGHPAIYDTLQEALLAFLIYEVSKGRGMVTSGFPYNYPTWLRTVVLIVADAQRDPALLKVTVPTDNSGVPSSVVATHQRELTMAIGDNWNCLCSNTFKAIWRTFSRPG